MAPKANPVKGEPVDPMVVLFRIRERIAIMDDRLAEVHSAARILKDEEMVTAAVEVQRALDKLHQARTRRLSQEKFKLNEGWRRRRDREQKEKHVKAAMQPFADELRAKITE